jgi:hypothetical protein
MFENCPTAKRIREENKFNDKCDEIWQMFRFKGLFNSRECVKDYCDFKIKEGNTDFNWEHVKFKIIEKNIGGE